MMKSIFLTSLFLLLPVSAAALTADVYVDTGNRPINALEASIRLPEEFELNEIYDGNSAIVVWLSRPILEASIITFSGINPGGFQGRHVVLSISGDFTEADLNKMTFTHVRALSNDGTGSEVPVSFSTQISEIPSDNVPPESFTPIISKSPDIFEGRHFLSFLTQDKGVGIDHYEYASSLLLKPGAEDWKQVESPLELTKKDLKRKIYVKAVDRSGNEIVRTVVGPYYYIHIAIWFIIIVSLLCVLSYRKRLFSH